MGKGFRRAMCVLLLAMGCTLEPVDFKLDFFQPQASNFPSSGNDCVQPPHGLGHGTLTGSSAFPVATALEGFGADDAGNGGLGIVLSSSSCTEPTCVFGFVLPPYRRLSFDINPVKGAPTIGAVPIVPASFQSAGFPSTGGALDVLLADAGETRELALGGTLAIDTLDACSLDGHFDVTFPSQGAGSISGTFHAVYAQSEAPW
jgi:hypothetical protein